MLGAFTFASIGAEKRNVCYQQQNILEGVIKREDKYENSFESTFSL